MKQGCPVCQKPLDEYALMALQEIPALTRPMGSMERKLLPIGFRPVKSVRVCSDECQATMETWMRIKDSA